MASHGRLPSLFIRGIQRSDFRNVREIGERRSAVQATCILEIDKLAAGVTMEDSDKAFRCGSEFPASIQRSERVHHKSIRLPLWNEAISGRG